MKQAYRIEFNDEYILVIDKIAKLLVQPSPRKETLTLTSLLERDFDQQLYPCHRLDRETTGLLIYAKEPDIQSAIMAQFRQGMVKKKYLAFVKGRLRRRQGALEGKIIDRQGQRFREKAKHAKTLYRVLAEGMQWSFLELEPLTGRTNQLRIQLAKIGNPILGDDVYAFRRDFPVKFRRLALHAAFLGFMHPVSRQHIRLKAALPRDMEDFLSGKA